MTRYEVAMEMKEHWNILNWKGDEHTNGIYFDIDYAYLLERNYGLRIKHHEASPSVFYVPDFSLEEEDKVCTDYPYQNMKKRPNKFQPLFSGEEIEAADLILLFEEDGIKWTQLPVAPLYDALSSITKKRERDRSWVVMDNNGGECRICLIHKDKSVKDINVEGEKTEVLETLHVMINANDLFHALNFFNSADSILISRSRDKIKLTNKRKSSSIEVILSLPKESVQKEISSWFDR